MATREQLLAAAAHLAVQSRQCDEMAQTASYPGPYIVAAQRYGEGARLCFAEAEKIPTAAPVAGTDESGSPTRE